jgi:hypothetical protein
MDAPLKRDYQHDFDLNDPELNTRWDEVVAHLHTGCPVARSDVGEGYWVVSRYTDVVRCAKEWATFSAADGFMVNRPEGLPYFAPGECDPPLHEALRAAIAPFLRPRAVGALEPAIRRHANALIDAFCAQGQTDIVASFANPLPQLVFSVEVAGMDPVDMPYLLEVFDLSGPAEQRASNFALGIARIDAYLRQRAEQAPRGDIVDALLAFEFEGYTWQDKVGTLSQLTIGGIGTTGFAISGGLHYLATHPDARRRLVADHSLIPRAIDEFLRVFMGAPNMARRVKAERGAHAARRSSVTVFRCREPRSERVRTPTGNRSGAAGQSPPRLRRGQSQLYRRLAGATGAAGGFRSVPGTYSGIPSARGFRAAVRNRQYAAHGIAAAAVRPGLGPQGLHELGRAQDARIVDLEIQ